MSYRQLIHIFPAAHRTNDQQSSDSRRAATAAEVACAHSGKRGCHVERATSAGSQQPAPTRATPNAERAVRTDLAAGLQPISSKFSKKNVSERKTSFQFMKLFFTCQMCVRQVTVPANMQQQLFAATQGPGQQLFLRPAIGQQQPMQLQLVSNGNTKPKDATPIAVQATTPVKNAPRPPLPGEHCFISSHYRSNVITNCNMLLEFRRVSRESTRNFSAASVTGSSFAPPPPTSVTS